MRRLTPSFSSSSTSSSLLSSFSKQILAFRNFGAAASSGFEPPKGPSKESGPRWTKTIPNEMNEGEINRMQLQGDELVENGEGFNGNPDEIEARENYLGEVHEIGSNGKLAAIMAWNNEQKLAEDPKNQIRAGAAFNQIEQVDPTDGQVKYYRGDRPGSNSGMYRKWEDEPSIEDLDVSIPQVNCAFVADLLAKRKKEQAQQWGDIDPDRRAQNIAEKREERERERIEKGEKKKEGETGSYTADQEKKERDEEDLEDPLDYDEVRNLALHPSDGIVLIDVRTVAEVTSWGTIEGAKIIPMHEFWEAFHLHPDDFENQYGFERPDKNATLLFFCHHGPRSLMAAQIAHHLGYGNVIHLREGFYEWSKQFFLLCRRWMVHDHTTGINNRRLLEFETAKAIAADVAPEFNDIVDAETELIRIDHSRSVGEKQLPIPESVQQLSLEFEERREKLEIESGALSKKLLELESSEGAERSHKELEEESHAANVRESKGFDPVLSNVPQLSEADMDAQDELLRRDYTSEAARVLRRRKASERTGIPESFMFRRKEQPHGTGR